LARSVDPFKIIQDKNAAVFNNMTSALDKFVETGKLSFGDLAKSIIKDLIKIELRANATNLFRSAGGFSGIFSALSGAMGGGGSPMTADATSNMFAGIKLGNLAQGGAIDRPSIVGEAGPEVFIPKSAGTIVPNHAIGGGTMTTNNTYVTNNISAVDAQSVAQLFANNRKTLLGVVETARKELPTRQRF
jgi:lambda family phage tail tape measure protein